MKAGRSSSKKDLQAMVPWLNVVEAIEEGNECFIGDYKAINVRIKGL